MKKQPSCTITKNLFFYLKVLRLFYFYSKKDYRSYVESCGARGNGEMSSIILFRLFLLAISRWNVSSPS